MVVIEGETEKGKEGEIETFCRPGRLITVAEKLFTAAKKLVTAANGN